MGEITRKGAALSFSNVFLSYGERAILDNISFVVPPDELVALVGPNGAGKTTIMRLILGEEKPDLGKIQISRRVERIGYMPQAVSDLGELASASILDFMLSVRSLDRMSSELKRIYTELGNSEEPQNALLEQLGEVQDRFEQTGGYEAESRIKAILSGLQIPTENLNAPVTSLSGGMKTRLFLARVLYSDPDLLLLDEPTNHLDEEAIRWLGDYLKKFKGAGIVISHQQEFLDKFCQRTFYLNPISHKLEIYKGNYSFFLNLKGKMEEQQAKLAARQEKEIARLWKFINRWRAGSRAKQAQSQLKKIEKMTPIEKPKREKEIKVIFSAKERSGDPVLTLNGITKSYNGKRLFPPLSFSVRQKERVAIMGPNGAGKTTLLKMIVGLEPPDVGEINLGHHVNIGYYAQEHEILDSALSPIQQLEHDFPGERYQRIRAVLGHFLLSSQALTPISKLSQGEKARLALAKIAMSGANFLILDEPTNHLDARSKRKLIEALADYEGSILIVSHDEEFLTSLNIDRILVLPEGKIIYSTATSDMFT